MPIYEFYCPDCHMVFNFLSRSVNTQKRPPCPRCRRPRLERQVSRFAATGNATEPGSDTGDSPVDEARMERAISSLAGEAENLSEEDPRQAARLMRKFSSMTGMELGRGMETAIARLEAGEDPETIEAEMGDAMEHEDPFILPDAKGKSRRRSGAPPRQDPKLYDL